MNNKYLLFSVFTTLFFLFSGDTFAQVTESSDYPVGAKTVQFKEIKSPTDSLKLIAEINILDGSKAPEISIVDMEVIGDRLYFVDRKQNLVHIIDKNTLKYIDSIGGSGPDKLIRAFSLDVTKDNNLLVGTAQGPHLLKAFSPAGELIKSYPNNNPPAWFISNGVNESFISDSIAYITKMFADKGSKIIRYNLRGGEANQIDEIVPVTDLHKELDSVMKAKIITKMSVLKSNVVDSIFYVVPTNKYLINSYNMKGEKQSSIDLRKGIPPINRAYSIMRKIPLINSYFYSAVLDDRDNIYFHIDGFKGIEVNDSEGVVATKLNSNKGGDLKLISVNLLNKTYRMFNVESRHVAALKIIGDKLWCFDIIKSQVLVYQMPD